MAAITEGQRNVHVLDMLNETVQTLYEKNMNIEALGCLEQSLYLKKKMFGIESSVVRKTFKDVILSCNSIAMQLLAESRFDKCLEFLRKAEALTSPGNYKFSESLRVLTFNNLGCCYRRLGKLKVALKYLSEAAKLGACSRNISNLSLTHLNICAIQSELGRHSIAMEHAQAAVFHCQEELVSSEMREEDTQELEDVLEAKTKDEKMITMAIAYHNLAVEMEFVGKLSSSLQWYKKALQIVWKQRESHTSLCDSFKLAYSNAKKKSEGSLQEKVAPMKPQSKQKAQRPVSQSTKKMATKVRKKKSKPKSKTMGNAASICWRDAKPPKIDIGRVKPQRSYSNNRTPREIHTDEVFQGSPVNAALGRRTKRTTTSEGSTASSGSSNLLPFSAFMKEKPAIPLEKKKQSIDEDNFPLDKQSPEKYCSSPRSEQQSLTMRAESCLQEFNACLRKTDDMSQVDYLRQVREATRSMDQTISRILSQKHELEMAPDVRVHQLPSSEKVTNVNPSTCNAEERALKDCIVKSVDNDQLVPVLPVSPTTLNEDEDFSILENIDKFVEEIDEIHEIAAIKIQSLCRGICARRNSFWLKQKSVEESVKQTKAVKRESQNIRASKAGCPKLKKQEIFEINSIAATFLAACIRGYIVRSRHRRTQKFMKELVLTQKNEVTYIAVTRIQALIRGFLIRNRMERFIAAEIARGFVLQMHMVRELRHVERIEPGFLQESERIRNLAALKIQSCIRGKQAREHFEAEISCRHAAAARIQETYQKRKTELHNRSRAAIKIQAYVRGKQTRLFVEAEMAGRHAAAERLQGLWYGYNTRKRLRTIEKEKRHNIERSQVAHIAATTIQNQVRRVYSDRSAYRIAATLIQSVVRRYLAVIYTLRLRNEYNNESRVPNIEYSDQNPVFCIAATTIQSVVRRYLAIGYTQQLRYQYKSDDLFELSGETDIVAQAATVIQAVYRGNKARKEYSKTTAAEQPSIKLGLFAKAKSKWRRAKLVESKPKVKRRFPWTKPADSTSNDALLLNSDTKEKQLSFSPTPPNTERPNTPLSPRSQFPWNRTSSSSTNVGGGEATDGEECATNILPKKVKRLFDAFKETPEFTAGRVKTMDLSIIQSLGLDFSSFKREFEISTNPEEAASALDGLIILISENEKYQSLTQLIEFGRLIDEKMKQDAWNREVAIQCCWLLCEYDVHLFEFQKP